MTAADPNTGVDSVAAAQAANQGMPGAIPPAESLGISPLPGNVAPPGPPPAAETLAAAPPGPSAGYVSQSQINDPLNFDPPATVSFLGQEFNTEMSPLDPNEDPEATTAPADDAISGAISGAVTGGVDNGDNGDNGGDGGWRRGGSIGHHHMHDDDESWDSVDAALRLAGHRKGYADAGAVDTVQRYHDPRLDVPEPWPTLPPLPYKGPEFRNLPNRPAPELQEHIAEDVAPFVPVPGIGIAGKALKTAAPMTIPALAGVAGLSFTGANAEGESAKSPAQQHLDAILEQQHSLTEQLKAAGANRDLQMKGDPARNIRPGAGKSYQQSVDQFNDLSAQLKALTAPGGPLEKAQASVDAEHADQMRSQSDEKVRQAEENMSSPEKFLRDYGPSLGYPAGMVLGTAFGHGVGKGFGMLDKYVTNRANNLVNPMPKDIPGRVSRVNQFWTEGGSGEEPFVTAPSQKPPFASNAAAAPARELYPPPGAVRKGLEFGINAVGSGGFGYESYIAGQKLSDAKQERDAALAALKTDPSEANVKRFQNASYMVGVWEGAQTLGRIGAGGQMVGGLTTMGLRGTPRPDIHAAEAERLRLEGYLAGRRPRPLPPPISPNAPVPGGGGGRQQQLLAAPPNAKALPPPAGEGQAQPPSTDLSLTNPPVPSGKRGLGGSKSKGNKPETEEDAKQIFNPDDPSKLTKGMRRGGIVGRALGLARNFASGGAVHAGPIQQAADGGRTDTVPLDVASGAYVIPADVVSAQGQGDTNAGYRVLTHMFGPQAPRPPGPDGKTVPIMAAGGEFVISPDGVAKVGRGDVAAGHDALDQWVKMERRKNIMALRKLPGPAKN